MRLNLFTQLRLLQENFEHFGLCDSKSAYFKTKNKTYSVISGEFFEIF